MKFVIPKWQVTCTSMHITMLSALNVIYAVFQKGCQSFETLFIFLFQYRKKTRLDLALCTSLNSRSLSLILNT